MQEIEVSSRLYIENGARYMTATLLCRSDSDAPRTTPVTFILSHHRLATVRYDDPRPFAIVENKLGRNCPVKVAGDTIMFDLLDAVIDRAADILEHVGGEVDELSRSIFEPEDSAPPVYTAVLKKLGRLGDLTSKVRESLVSIGRVLLFLANESEGLKWGKETRTQLQTMQRDVISLTDHASYIGKQSHLPARCDARRRQFAAERDHQDFFGRCGGADAAHDGRLDLRHELQEHARTRHALRLSGRAHPHAGRGRRAVHVFQMEEVAVISTARYCERSEAIRSLTRVGRR
jgi:hypothetical protein